MLPDGKFTGNYMKLLENYCKIHHSTHNSTHFVIAGALVINKPP